MPNSKCPKCGDSGYINDQPDPVWETDKPCPCPAGIKKQFPGAVVFSPKQKVILACMVEVGLMRAKEYKQADLTGLEEMTALVKRIEEDFKGTLVFIPDKEAR